MLRLHLLRLFSLIALAVSAALAVDYLHPSPEFCGYQSDCDKVLFSGFAGFAGVPLPFLGLVVFGTLLAASLFPGQPSARVVRCLAVAAGAGGVLLIAVQIFFLHALCPYCLVVDTAAVVIGAVGSWRRGHEFVATTPIACCLWGVAALAACGAGAGWTLVRLPAETPTEITSLWVDDKINVVEVADFECRQCRKMHGVLVEFLKEHGERLHFVQLTAAMPGHRHARDASRAYLCAQAQGKGAAMAEELFAAADLSPDGCAKMAEALGLAMPEFDHCTADPATDERLDHDLAWVQAVSPKGLPVIWIQDEMLFGLQPVETLEAVLERAEQREKTSHAPRKQAARR